MAEKQVYVSDKISPPPRRGIVVGEIMKKVKRGKEGKDEIGKARGKEIKRIIKKKKWMTGEKSDLKMYKH